jgi:predicted nucleic acid-binding protein
MTARSFADTNIAVYALDADPRRRGAALAVMRARPVISVQVVNEFLSVALGKMRLPRQTANRLASILLRRCEVVDLTVDMVRAAIAIGERYGISHWDALIVAAALAAGCETLYSEDLQDGQLFEAQLTVRNPFAPGAESSQVPPSPPPE